MVPPKDVFALMQHALKLVCPTKHGLVAMPPKLVDVSHLMKEHFPKDRWMVALECVVDVTTLIVAPKKSQLWIE